MNFENESLVKSIPIFASRCRTKRGTARKRLNFSVEDSNISKDSETTCSIEVSAENIPYPITNNTNNGNSKKNACLLAIERTEEDGNEHQHTKQNIKEDRNKEQQAKQDTEEDRHERSLTEQEDVQPKTTNCNDLLQTAIAQSQIPLENMSPVVENSITILSPLSPRSQRIEEIIADLYIPKKNNTFTDLPRVIATFEEENDSEVIKENFNCPSAESILHSSIASTSKENPAKEINTAPKRSKKVFLDFLSEDEGDFQWSSSSWSMSEIESENEPRVNKRKKKKRFIENDDAVVGERGKPKPKRSNKKAERKKLKDKGQEYMTNSGKKVNEKTMLNNPCKEKNCKYNCWKISDDRRSNIFKHFWSLDTLRRKDWLVAMTKREPIKRKRVKTSTVRTNTYSYFINSGEGRDQVCQKFLLATLNITQTFVHYTVSNSELGSAKSDLRGKTIPANKTKDEHLNAARNYIINLPVLPSHYTRKDSTRLYLPNEFKSLSHIYFLYKETFSSEGRDIIGEKVFKHLFKSEFNISIHHPKKDKCLKCISFKDNNDPNILIKKLEHEKDINNSCERFKTHRKITNNNSNILCVSFDLQKVLNTPYGESMLLYYSRKYSVYNLTFYENGTRNGFCYTWGESDAKRGSNEICTILNKYIRKVDSRGTITTLLFYCDSCPGQNKNKIVLAALHATLQQCVNITKIQINFLLPGHTYMPADSIHAVIERSIAKGSIIWAPSQWETIFAVARKHPRPYDVEVLSHKDFNNWASFADKYFKGNLVGKINKIRIATCIKTFPNTILLKYSMDPDTSTEEIPVVAKIRTPPQDRLYNSMLPISKAKYQDLIKLCNTNVIPQRFHAEYKNLPSGAVKDVLVDTDIEDEDIDD